MDSKRKVLLITLGVVILCGISVFIWAWSSGKLKSSAEVVNTSVASIQGSLSYDYACLGEGATKLEAIDVGESPYGSTYQGFIKAAGEYIFANLPVGTYYDFGGSRSCSYHKNIGTTSVYGMCKISSGQPKWLGAETAGTTVNGPALRMSPSSGGAIIKVVRSVNCGKPQPCLRPVKEGVVYLMSDFHDILRAPIRSDAPGTAVFNNVRPGSYSATVFLTSGQQFSVPGGIQIEYCDVAEAQIHIPLGS